MSPLQVDIGVQPKRKLSTFGHFSPFQCLELNIHELTTMFLRCTVPYSADVSIFWRYFATCRALEQKTKPGDDVLRRRFRLLFLFLAYCTLLQLTLFICYHFNLSCFSSSSLFSQLLPLLLFDVLPLLNIDRHYHLLYALFCAFSAFLHWTLYFRRPQFRAALIGPVEQALTLPVFHRKALIIINLMKVFILAIDLILCAIFVIFVWALAQRFTDAVQEVGNSIVGVVTLCSVSFLLFPLLLFHLGAFVAFYLSFVSMFTFLGTLTLFGLTFFSVLLQRNFVELKSSTQLLLLPGCKLSIYRRGVAAHRLGAALAANIRLFLFVFNIDRVFGQLFTVYLLVLYFGGRRGKLIVL